MCYYNLVSTQEVRLLNSDTRTADRGWRCVCVNQAYSRLSATHGHITDCKLDSVVHAGFVWPNNLRPTVFRCQATDSILPQVSRKESLRPFILTPSHPVSCLTHNAKRQAEKRKPPSFYVFAGCDAVEDRTPASCTPSRRSTGDGW